MSSYFTKKNLSWGVGEKLWSIVFDGIAFVLFAKMLGPEILGQYALVMVLIGLANVFIEFGTVDAIIRENENAKFESSVFWLSLGLGACYLAVLYLLAPFIGGLYEFKEYDQYITSLFPVIIMSSLIVVPVARLKRDGEFHKLSKRNIVAGFFAKIVGLILAYIGLGIWGLIAMALTNKIIELFMIALLCKWRPLFVFDVSELKTRINFILYLSISKIIIYFSKKLDVIIVSYFFGIATLGIYSVASKLMKYINKLISGVIVPIYYSDVSKMDVIREKGAVREKYNDITHLISVCYWCVFLIFTLFSEELIIFLFGSEWSAAAWITSILFFTLRFVAQGSISAQLLKRYGESKYIYHSFLFSFFALTSFFLLGAYLDNMLIVVWSTFISSLVYNYMFFIKCHKLIGLQFGKLFLVELKVLSILLVATLVFIGLMEFIWPDAMQIYETLIAVLLYATICMLAVIFFDRQAFALLKNYMR